MNYTKHHMLFERKDYTTPLEKKVRRLFTISAPDANHRLLHLLLAPPPKPDQRTLLMMRDMGDYQTVIEQLAALPIRHHFERQLEIINYDENEVYKMMGGISVRRSRAIENTRLIIEGLQQAEKPFVADIPDAAPTLQEQREYGWNSQGDYDWQPRERGFDVT